MSASGYRRKLVACSVVAIAFSYAIIVGIDMAPRQAFGLPDDSFAIILEQVALIPVVVGPVAGVVILPSAPERSPWKWWYATIAVLGFLAPLLVPAIMTA